MDIYKKAEKISNKQDFIEFLALLKKDFKQNKKEWENNNLELFLEGLYGYCVDTKGELLDWKKFAKILLAAKVYE